MLRSFGEVTKGINALRRTGGTYRGHLLSETQGETYGSGSSAADGTTASNPGVLDSPD